MRKKNRGFSLLEMVVVVGIIMVLSNFIVPKIRTMMAKAKDAKALEGVSTLRRVSHLYETDNSKSFDPGFIKDSKRSLISIFTLKELVKDGYLDQRAADFFDPRKNGALTFKIEGDSVPMDKLNAVVKVGRVTTKVGEKCIEKNGNSYIYLVLEPNGVDISFFPIKDMGEISNLENKTEEIYYNSNCELWYEK